MSLADIIIEHIKKNGPIGVGEYMSMCLGYPGLGYYMRKDPFGKQGDFTTAPEVSQMFGEMVGLWVADIWVKLGSPSKFILCECGPGRGTLMKDILRTLQQITPDSLSAAEIHLVETSPLLRDKQKESLSGTQVEWHESLNTLPNYAPIIFIGNEFFDALPVEQAVKVEVGWRQRVVTEKFEFGIGEPVSSADFPLGYKGDIYEYAPVRDDVWKDICARIKIQRGAAIMIDYGFTIDSVGDTLQSVKDHKYVSVFETPGETDISSHVNFSKLNDLADGLAVHGPGTQAEFLKSMGIDVRAQKLIEYNPEQQEKIEAGLQRLVDPDKMGEFKVIYVSNT